ncbi:MAG: enoyl-CoA hydratase/isomerase family protein [Gemmatimonadetes bacterium]|nr:enoyl-CoA hydratase/isomerase family protein [Gemmatimonadota bacterium]
MPDFETIRLDRDGAVAILTIDRQEKRNALSSTVRSEIIAALDALRDDEEVRVLVITGAGDKAFIAGADIGEFAQRTHLEQRGAMSGRTVFAEIAAFPKPVIAMINGFCLGGGCELAMACDIRVASDAAKLGQPEVNLGIIPGGGGTQRLPRIVGTGQAMRLVLSGEIIDAAEALRIGLVDLVHPAAQLREKTMEMARTIAAKSPVALRMAKAAVRAAEEMPLSAGDAYETELFITAFSSDDRREGVSAFLEKRPPQFPGR